MRASVPDSNRTGPAGCRRGRPPAIGDYERRFVCRCRRSCIRRNFKKDGAKLSIEGSLQWIARREITGTRPTSHIHIPRAVQCDVVSHIVPHASEVGRKQQGRAGKIQLCNEYIGGSECLGVVSLDGIHDRKIVRLRQSRKIRFSGRRNRDAQRHFLIGERLASTVIGGVCERRSVRIELRDESPAAGNGHIRTVATTA